MVKREDTGRILMRMRVSLGLNRKQASNKLGITQTTYRKYETYGVVLERLFSIALKLGLDVVTTTRISIPYSDDISISVTLGDDGSSL